MMPPTSLERLRPVELISHFVGDHAVEEIEEPTHCLAGWQLIGDDNSRMVLAIFQPFAVELVIVGRIKSQEGAALIRRKI